MFSNPTRARRRLFAALAIGLVLIIAGAIPLQNAILPGGRRDLLLLLVALGCLISIPASLGLTAIELAGLRRPAIGTELHDELSARNSVRAMAIGYVALVTVAGCAILLSLFMPLPLLSALTIIVVAGVLAHLVSFALLERQGDDD